MLIMWKKKSQRRKWGIPYCSPVPLSFATIWRTEQMFICWFFHLGGVSGPLGAGPFPLIKEWIKYWNFWKLANLNKDRYFMSEGRFKLGTGSPVYEGFYLSPAPRFQHNMDCTPTTTLQNQTLGPSVPTTGHQCQEAVLLASQDNWQIFFHHSVPNSVLSDSEITSASTLCVMEGKQSVSSAAFHFKFSFALFHSFSISTCFGMCGRKRKRKEGAETSPRGWKPWLPSQLRDARGGYANHTVGP